MPQLDLDILEDFLFFAFAGLLLGLGDSESEEKAVEVAADRHLAHFYLERARALRSEVTYVTGCGDRTIRGLK